LRCVERIDNLRAKAPQDIVASAQAGIECCARPHQDQATGARIKMACQLGQGLVSARVQVDQIREVEDERCQSWGIVHMHPHCLSGLLGIHEHQSPLDAPKYAGTIWSDGTIPNIGTIPRVGATPGVWTIHGTDAAWAEPAKKPSLPPGSAEQREGQGHPDSHCLVEAKHDHRERGGKKSHRVTPIKAPQPRKRLPFHHAHHSHQDRGSERWQRQEAEPMRGGGQRGQQYQHRDHAGQLCVGARLGIDRRTRQAAGNRKPAAQPSSDVRGSQSEQFAVVVDPLPAPATETDRAALSKEKHHHRHRYGAWHKFPYAPLRRVQSQTCHPVQADVRQACGHLSHHPDRVQPG